MTTMILEFDMISLKWQSAAEKPSLKCKILKSKSIAVRPHVKMPADCVNLLVSDVTTAIPLFLSFSKLDSFELGGVFGGIFLARN